MSEKAPLQWHHDGHDGLFYRCGDIDPLLARLERELAEARGKALAAVDAEEELDGDMPDEMWNLLHRDRGVATEALRICVRQTKQGIRERIKSALPGAPRWDGTERRRGERRVIRKPAKLDERGVAFYPRGANRQQFKPERLPGSDRRRTAQEEPKVCPSCHGRGWINGFICQCANDHGVSQFGKPIRTAQDGEARP